MSFVRSYNKFPTVLLTAKHSSSGGNAAPECNGIVSWVEVNILQCATTGRPSELFELAQSVSHYARLDSSDRAEIQIFAPF